MGCGASKNTVQNTIVESTVAKQATETRAGSVAASTALALVQTAPVLATKSTAPVDQAAPQICETLEASRKSKANSGLSRTVVPSIPTTETTAATFIPHKPVAFEIPLDDDMFRPRVALTATSVTQIAGNAVVAAPAESIGPNNSVKLSLPKLALSERDILAKLANTEERWKDLERAQESRRKRRAKPALTSAAAHAQNTLVSEGQDPAVLKQRLIEKEERAASRRAKELLKLQNKLAKQDEHAKLVQERKKKLGKLSNEDLNLSWGGEDDDEVQNKAFGQKIIETSAPAVGIDGLIKMKLTRKDTLLDNDSGKGSSAASVNNGSRSGSGRSLGFAEDGTEIIENI